MFKHLMVFGYKRSNKEAVGFYVAWLVFIVILSALAGGITGGFLPPEDTFQDGFHVGLRVGGYIAVAAVLVITFMIVRDKKILTNFSSIILLLLSGVLAFIGGGILGLIIPAYLTTKAVGGAMSPPPTV